VVRQDRLGRMEDLRFETKPSIVIQRLARLRVTASGRTRGTQADEACRHQPQARGCDPGKRSIHRAPFRERA
jgi:hypothetical protein